MSGCRFVMHSSGDHACPRRGVRATEEEEDLAARSNYFTSGRPAWNIGMNVTTWCCAELNTSQTPVPSWVTATASSYALDKYEINTFYFYETEQFTLLWTLFALIVLGNSAVLAALLWNNKGRKSRMNFFIMQLALADMSVGLISVLTDIVWRITVAWNAGNAACKLIRFLQAVVTYSSTYVLVALSIDRYDAITRPMSFSGSWRRARVLVALAWIFSVLFSLPIVLLYHETSVQGRLQCWIDFPEAWQWQLYMTLVAFALFVFPALIITACYTVIVATIWSQGRQLQPPPLAASTNGHGGSSHSSSRNKAQQRSGRNEEEEERSSRRASSRGIIPRAKIKTVKMTFVIVIVFIACWSPYIVFDLLQVYGHVPRTQTNIAVATFIQSLAPLNSAANPLIYCIFSTSVGRALRPSAAAAAAAQARPQKGATAHLAGKVPALVHGTAALVGAAARL